jgi:hypothetical protein
MRKLILFMALAAVSVFAADPSGKWTWEMEGRDGQKRTQNLTLKAEGDKLTGSMAGRQGERPIENGKVSGDEISFTMTMQMGGESRKMTYKGKVAGDELKLNMSVEGGQMARDFVAKRAQ